MAPLPVIAAVATIAASAFSVGETLTQKKPKAPTAPTLPPPPDPAADQPERQTIAQRRNKASGASAPPATLLTGGQGLTTSAPAERKTLLGL